MVKARKKSTVKKTTRRKSSVKSGKKPVPKPEPVATVVTMPSQPPVVTPVYKDLPVQPGSRLKLWLAVSLSMAVIVLIWAYTLSRTVLSTDGVKESLADSDIDEFIGSLGDSLSNLKTTTESLETPTTSSTNQPSTEELDNLFSDIE